MTQLFQAGFASAEVEKRFTKYLDALDQKSARQVRDRMTGLGIEPRPAGKSVRRLKPPVAAFKYLAQYRMRVGDHRVLFDIDDAAKRVIFLDIRRRNERTYDD